MVGTDVASGVYGLVGAIIGAAASAWVTLAAQRGAFKREQAAEKRAFHIEALKRSQESLLALFGAAQGGAKLAQPSSAVESEYERLRLAAIMWTDRLRDKQLHTDCSRAIIACTGYFYAADTKNAPQPTPAQKAAAAIECLASTQQKLGERLAAFYE